MQPPEKTYVIEKLEDFLRVPSEKLACCLAEFEDMLTGVNSIFHARDFERPDLGEFTWVDDGNPCGEIRQVDTE